MRPIRLLLPISLGVLALTACDSSVKERLRTLAHADSLRTDSLVSIKNDLLNEVMTSTQFVNDLNGELAKLKSHPVRTLSNASLGPESDAAAIKEERANVVKRIRELVARLDSSEARVASLRARASRLSGHDSTLVGQVAAYERTISELRETVARQKTEYEATIAKQNTQIASLNMRIDTVTTQNVQLAGDKRALSDTVSELTTERNTAYYVIGTKDELIRQGILVEEGHKRLLLIGSRSVSPARDLDTSKFTRIDRSKDRVINFPAGDYTIFSRQNPIYAAPFSSHDGKLSGGLRIEQPDRFWEPSKFLIIVKA